MLAALWDRERTGLGQLIEFAQAENVMQEIGEYFLDYQMNHRIPAVRSATPIPYMLQDVLPDCRGRRWVAISIRDDRDWAALETVTGPPTGWPRAAPRQRARNAAGLKARAHRGVGPPARTAGRGRRAAAGRAACRPAK